MSEHSPTPVSEESDRHGPENLNSHPPVSTDDPLQTAMADFRSWYEATVNSTADLEFGDVPPLVDVHTILANYLALRQEVTLQTRAVRAQQEQNGELLQQLNQSLALHTRSISRMEQMEKQGLDDLLEPLLKTLIESHDALSLATREMVKGEGHLESLLDNLLPDQKIEDLEDIAPLQESGPTRSFWARWILSPSAEANLRASQELAQKSQVRLHEQQQRQLERNRQLQRGLEKIRQIMRSFLTGYKMSLDRLDRALRRHNLEPIPVIGEMFDPDSMEAIGSVEAPDRMPGEVVEEVRRGYRYKGKIFRHALVRAVRS